MSARPWMPFFGDVYFTDTAHLTSDERDAYLRLIWFYWSHNGLPDDPGQLARIASLSPRSWQKHAQTLQAFFHDGWRHKRIDEELAKSSAISEKRREAVGKRSDRSSTIVTTRARATLQSQLQSQEKNAPAEQSAAPSSPSSTEPVARMGGRQATRPCAREAFFDQFWKAYPARAGANPKQPARDLFEAAVKAGTDPVVITEAAKSYAAAMRESGEAGTRFVAQAKRWLGEQRWLDHAPKPAAAGPPQPPDPSMPTHAELEARYAQRAAERRSRLVAISESEAEGLLQEGAGANPLNRQGVHH